MNLIDSTKFLEVLGPLLLGLLVFVGVTIAVLYVFKIALPNFLHRRKSKKSAKIGEKWRDDQDPLRSLRAMTPSEFEEYIANLFHSLGYKSFVVGRTGDHGVDVEIEKDGVHAFIQCKKYSDLHKVGEEEVRNFLGALDHQHSRGKGYFITTNIFTLPAEKFAEDKPIELVDGGKLVKYIRMSETIALKSGDIGRNEKN